MLMATEPASLAKLDARCPLFVTNDRRLPTLPGLRILQLRDHEWARAGRERFRTRAWERAQREHLTSLRVNHGAR